ncbi:MAG: hypothetical protein Q9181_006408 [Wetmoreana brouardii]
MPKYNLDDLLEKLEEENERHLQNAHFSNPIEAQAENVSRSDNAMEIGETNGCSATPQPQLVASGLKEDDDEWSDISQEIESIVDNFEMEGTSQQESGLWSQVATKDQQLSSAVESPRKRKWNTSESAEANDKLAALMLANLLGLDSETKVVPDGQKLSSVVGPPRKRKANASRAGEDDDRLAALMLANLLSDANKQRLDATMNKKNNHFVRRHELFTEQSLSTYTALQRRAFERDVYDFARALKLTKSQAKRAVVSARRLYGEEEYDSDNSTLDDEEADHPVTPLIEGPALIGLPPPATPVIPSIQNEMISQNWLLQNEARRKRAKNSSDEHCDKKRRTSGDSNNDGSLKQGQDDACAAENTSQPSECRRESEPPKEQSGMYTNTAHSVVHHHPSPIGEDSRVALSSISERHAVKGLSNEDHQSGRVVQKAQSQIEMTGEGGYHQGPIENAPAAKEADPDPPAASPNNPQRVDEKHGMPVETSQRDAQEDILTADQISRISAGSKKRVDQLSEKLFTELEAVSRTGNEIDMVLESFNERSLTTADFEHLRGGMKSVQMTRMAVVATLDELSAVDPELTVVNSCPSRKLWANLGRNLTKTPEDKEKSKGAQANEESQERAVRELNLRRIRNEEKKRVGDLLTKLLALKNSNPVAAEMLELYAKGTITVMRFDFIIEDLQEDDAKATAIFERLKEWQVDTAGVMENVHSINAEWTAAKARAGGEKKKVEVTKEYNEEAEKQNEDPATTRLGEQGWTERVKDQNEHEQCFDTDKFIDRALRHYMKGTLTIMEFEYMTSDPDKDRADLAAVPKDMKQLLGRQRYLTLKGDSPAMESNCVEAVARLNQVAKRRSSGAAAKKAFIEKENRDPAVDQLHMREKAKDNQQKQHRDPVAGF